MNSPWRVSILLLICFIYGIAWIGILKEQHVPIKRNILAGKIFAGQITPVFDPEIPVVSDFGDDSQVFWALSLDPFLNKDSIRKSIDSPSYRSQRILLPFITWCIIRNPSNVLFGLWFWNIFGYLIGIIGLYKLCIHFNMNSFWPVLLFMFNPGVINAIIHPMSDTLSIGLFLIALSFWVKDNKWMAGVLFSLACLTREYYAIYIFFIALFYIKSFKRIDFLKILPLVLTGIPMLIWQCVIRWRLGIWSISQSHRNFDWPLLGTIKAWTEYNTGHHKISNDIMAFCLILISTILLWISRSKVTYFPWYFVSIIAFLMILSGQAIMESSSSSIRISIPLMVFASMILIYDYRSDQHRLI